MLVGLTHIQIGEQKHKDADAEQNPEAGDPTELDLQTTTHGWPD